MKLSIATAIIAFRPLCCISASSPIMELTSTDNRFSNKFSETIDGSRDIYTERNARSLQVRNDAEWNILGQAIEGIGTDDNIGNSAAISGDGNRIVIGSPFAQANYVGEGVARVYEIDSNGAWSQIGSDIFGGDTNILLGSAVDISEDGKRIIVGRPGIPFSNTMGMAGIWKESNGEWIPIAYFNDAANNNSFGQSVGMCNTGKFVIIGSPVADASTGLAIVYQEDQDGSWSSSNIVGQTLNGMTGSAVNISGDCSRVVVNGRAFDTNSDSNMWYSTTGVYKLTSRPYIPSLTQIGMYIDEKAFNVDFDDFLTGSSTDLSYDGNRVIIGNIVIGSGYSQVYELQNNGWTQLGDNILGETTEDKTGYRVGICGEGNRVIVGSPGYGDCTQGRSQVFDYVAGAWLEVAVIDGNCDSSGTSVGISGDCKRVIIGEPKHASSDGTMLDIGRARVFQESLTTCGPCYEHVTSKYFFKINKKGKVKYGKCGSLAKKSEALIEKICKNVTGSNNGYGPPRDVCPKTCGVC